MVNKKKKIILIMVIIILFFTIGISFALFSYKRLGTSNSKLIVGDIYMHYDEVNMFSLSNVLPRDTYDENNYFEFTISGKNTNSSKDIVYDIILNYGDNITGKTRILDRFLKFTLFEKMDGESEFTKVLDSVTYENINRGARIWVNQINRNTTSHITNVYRLYY